jgi:hypothetical protein
MITSKTMEMENIKIGLHVLEKLTAFRVSK